MPKTPLPINRFSALSCRNATPTALTNRSSATPLLVFAGVLTETETEFKGLKKDSKCQTVKVREFRFFIPRIQYQGKIDVLLGTNQVPTKFQPSNIPLIQITQFYKDTEKALFRLDLSNISNYLHIL